MLPLESLPPHLSSITPQQWEELFIYIPKLESTTDFSTTHFGEAKEGVMNMPHVGLSKIVMEVVNKIQEMQLPPTFDYMHWKEGKELINKADFSNTDAITICKLFTVMIRADRFNEGLLASWFSDGTVTALLKRLRVLFGDEA